MNKIRVIGIDIAKDALTNQLRALLAEYDLIIPIGIQRLQQQLPNFIEDGSNDLTFTLRRYNLHNR